MKTGTKSMMQRMAVLSVSAIISTSLSTGISLAAGTQPTASEDAHYGEVAKGQPTTTPLTTPTSPLKPPASLHPSSTEPASTEKTQASTEKTQASTEKTQASTEKTSVSTPATGTMYSDEDIKTFVEAAKSVDQVKLKYEGQISKASGQAAIDQIKKEADLALSKTVTEKGMSITQYNQIHDAALKDPQLLARIQKQL